MEDLFNIENFNNTNSPKDNSKITKIVIIALALLIIIIIAIVGTMYYLNSKQMRFYVNGNSITIKSSYFEINDDNTIYISISDIAELLDIEYKKGEYEKISEDASKGYTIYKDGNTTEYSIFEANSDKIYKKNNNDDSKYMYMYLDEPIKYKDNKLYTTPDGIEKILNIQFDYNYNIYIRTIDYLENVYTYQISNYGYKEINDTFVNKKAMLKGYLVVKKDDEKMGIIKVGGTDDGREIVGSKYNDIQFIESMDIFIVTSGDKKGIVDMNGNQIISLDYSDIEIIDEDNKLFLVKQDDKYGIIKNGKIIIYVEYDEIGVDTSQYKSEEIKNPYLLFDNCIFVKRDGKWGMYNKNGKLILPIEYDGVGCTIGTRTNNSTGNVLTISDYEAIVIKLDSYYGVINSTGTFLIPCALQTVYSITEDGNKKIIIEGTQRGEQFNYDIEEYFNAVGIKKVNRKQDNIYEVQNEYLVNSDDSSNDEEDSNENDENDDIDNQEENYEEENYEEENYEE